MDKIQSRGSFYWLHLGTKDCPGETLGKGGPGAPRALQQALRLSYRDAEAPVSIGQHWFQIYCLQLAGVPVRRK